MFLEHRKRFCALMGEGVAVFPAAPEFIRNNDVYHEYRQDSYFYYLTGFEEPQAVLVLAPQHPEHKTILFVRPRDREMEIWNGRRAGVEGAVQQYGADVAYEIGEIEKKLPDYLQDVRTVYYRFGLNRAFDETMFRV